MELSSNKQCNQSKIRQNGSDVHCFTNRFCSSKQSSKKFAKKVPQNFKKKFQNISKSFLKLCLERQIDKSLSTLDIKARIAPILFYQTEILSNIFHTKITYFCNSI